MFHKMAGRKLPYVANRLLVSLSLSLTWNQTPKIYLNQLKATTFLCIVIFIE